MRSVTMMRTAKIGYIIMSAIMCAFGVMLIAVPDMSYSVLGIAGGCIMMLFGLIKLIGYFSKDLYRLAFQYDLAFGILFLVLGILMLVRPESLMNLFCFGLGVSVLADALFKVQIAVDSRRFGIRKWWLILAAALITGILGAVLIARPSESARILCVFLGISLLCEGLLNISTVITAVKIVKNQRPDIIEIEFDDQNGKE